jgi:hypothetical protein
MFSKIYGLASLAIGQTLAPTELPVAHRKWATGSPVPGCNLFDEDDPDAKPELLAIGFLEATLQFVPSFKKWALPELDEALEEVLFRINN